MDVLQPKAVPAGVGRTIRIFGGTEFVVKLTGQDTGGAFSLLDNTVPSGGGVPTHVHQREDETFFIQEGTLEFEVAGETIVAGPGDVVYGPRGVPHSLRVTSQTQGRMLLLATPAGFEECMDALSALGEGPSDMGEVVATCARYGIEFPPPAG